MLRQRTGGFTVAGPSKGARSQRVKVKARTKAKTSPCKHRGRSTGKSRQGKLPELSNFCCHPGKAGDIPFGSGHGKCYFTGSMIDCARVIFPSSCGSAEERLTWTVKDPASPCHAAAFSSYQVKERASSGTVTCRVCPGSSTTLAKPFSSWGGRGTCG